MTLDEIRGHKAKLKADMHRAIDDLVQAFNAKTGCAVRNIYVSTTIFQTMDDAGPTSCITEVGVDVETGV